MEFVDRRNPLPPPLVAIPYRAEPHPFTATAGGEVRTRFAKVYPDGHRETMSDDEIAILKRVQWFEAAIETASIALPAATEEPPPLPYKMEMFSYGTGVMRPTKVPPQGWGGELLTPDEIAVWEQLMRLEEKFKTLTSANKQDELSEPPPPQPAATLTSLNKSDTSSASAANNSDCHAGVPMETNPGDVPVSNLPTVKPKNFVEQMSRSPPIIPVLAFVTGYPEASPMEIKSDNQPIPNEMPSEDNATDTTELDTANRRAAVRQLVEQELLGDATRPNNTIAEIAGCSDELVRLIRKAMIGDGRLQNAPITRRDGTQYSRGVGHEPTETSDVS